MPKREQLDNVWHSCAAKCSRPLEENEYTLCDCRKFSARRSPVNTSLRDSLRARLAAESARETARYVEDQVVSLCSSGSTKEEIKATFSKQSGLSQKVVDAALESKACQGGLLSSAPSLSGGAQNFLDEPEYLTETEACLARYYFGCDDILEKAGLDYTGDKVIEDMPLSPEVAEALAIRDARAPYTPIETEEAITSAIAESKKMQDPTIFDQVGARYKLLQQQDRIK